MSHRKIVCKGCHREIKAIILKSYYMNKNLGRPSDPSYPYFLKLKITHHRRGILKGYCNRSGKVFTIRDGEYQRF